MSFFESKLWKRLMAMAYGLGASVVIAGALFKLMHWPFASAMLIAGMGTEAVIFIISAFEPLPKEYHWDTVFPELGESEIIVPAGSQGHVSQRQTQHPTQQFGSGGGGGGGLSFDLSIDQSTTDELKDKIRKFSDSMGKMAGISTLVDAASDLTGKMYSASGSIVSISESASALSDSYSKGSQAIQQLNDQSRAGLEQIHSGYEYYRGQLETLGRTMGALNSSYELYLQESKKVQSDYSTLHGEVQQLVGSMNLSINETQKLGAQMTSLNNNVENLNSIYGSMLTAVNSVLNK
ncbi:MAG: gliding motility protein GldL [Prevotellaceae bacterium]|jgi:gliding motility-associated protein GldL|nr:gliding motility protein GldL [Prevotellaceae bacterium]